MFCLPRYRLSTPNFGIALWLLCTFFVHVVHCAGYARVSLSEALRRDHAFKAATVNFQEQGTQSSPRMDQQVLNPNTADDAVLGDLLSAVEVMQSHFFAVWKGTWPHAIDWTAAVMATQLSAALNAITRSEAYVPRDSPFGSVSANTLAGYFSHLSAFYFGENAFALRTQANDDMLWVVLDWLEAIKFVNVHSDLHFSEDDEVESSWHGKHFIPAFAHRARIFWDLASRGWDTTLCGGGMIWSPYLTPYKNAITNQLYIAASVSMYLYFPGDDNGFPFASDPWLTAPGLPNVEPHDKKYLNAAIVAHEWLKGSHMTNSHGLYVDGFHIKGWRGGKDGSNGTGNCDERDNAVYTYNQGVILTGERGLWEATGDASYLTDGHELIRSVIDATGFHIPSPKWAGLGRAGILEEKCDASGMCSQNGQAFKGIFFHHLVNFCEPLPVGTNGPVFHRANRRLADLHRRSCQGYISWISHNAKAALGTRDANGEFGMWWTAGLYETDDDITLTGAQAQEGTDYRNDGVPLNDIWRLPGDLDVLPGTRNLSLYLAKKEMADPNCRGRGRTVETQSGGVAILKALHRLTELAQLS